jgi:hypothetical protein
MSPVGSHRAWNKPQSGQSTLEVLAGLVERVIFHNVENGFCVLRTRARGQFKAWFCAFRHPENVAARTGPMCSVQHTIFSGVSHGMECTLTSCCGNWSLSSKPALNASINRRCSDFYLTVEFDDEVLVTRTSRLDSAFMNFPIIRRELIKVDARRLQCCTSDHAVASIITASGKPGYL